MKNFDFDNGTSMQKNIFSDMANERLQREEQFHSKNYVLEMPCSHGKSAPQKLNFVIARAISKSYTRHFTGKCPCTFPHSYA